MFLQSLRSILNGNSEVTCKISLDKENNLVLLVVPTLLNAVPDTEDEIIAALQAALARPFRIDIPADENADECFKRNITLYKVARTPVIQQLDEYVSSLAKAQQTAKDTAAKKASDKPAVATKKAAKVKSKPVKKSAVKPAAKTAATKTPKAAPAKKAINSTVKPDAPSSEGNESAVEKTADLFAGTTL